MAATVRYAKCNQTAKVGRLRSQAHRAFCICLALFAVYSCSEARSDPARYLARIKAMYQQGRFAEARRAAEKEYRFIEAALGMALAVQAFCRVAAGQWRNRKAELFLNSRPAPREMLLSGRAIACSRLTAFPAREGNGS